MNKELTVTEYKDIRVLTTQQIAEAYGTDARVISNNFNNNKERYKENKHFICLEGEDLRAFKTNHKFYESSKINKLYLWTEKGAFLHAKSLNTDKAWEVYDKLVDSYFKKTTQRAMTAVEQLQLQSQAILEVNEKVNVMEQRVDKLEYDIPLYGAESDELSNHVKRKGVELLGGKKSNAYKDSKTRSAVYSDIYNQIKREYGLMDDNGRYISYKALKRRYIYDAHELVDGYELPTYLAEQITNINAQMNMEVA
ncbi:MAG: ORF6C domain-containing protein [Eubacteriales bacterium]|nr:ORF6C domain-containing protein [Eubacteriales bacterium]